MVDARNRGDLHAGSAEEDLVGERDLGAVDRALDDRNAELAARAAP